MHGGQAVLPLIDASAQLPGKSARQRAGLISWGANVSGNCPALALPQIYKNL
jgi:hypothetical protein